MCGLEVRRNVGAFRAEQVQEDEETDGFDMVAVHGRSRMGILVPMLSERARAVRVVRTRPRHPGFLSVQQQDLYPLLFPQPVVVAGHLHRRPFSRQQLIDAARNMHQHRTRRRTVHGADEALRSVETVIVRGKRQPGDIADACPGRIAPQDQVAEVDELVPCCRRLGCGIVPLDRPLGEGLGKEVGKVLLDLFGAGRVGNSWDQDRCEEARGVVDIEVGAGAGNEAEAVVGESGVGHDGR